MEEEASDSEPSKKRRRDGSSKGALPDVDVAETPIAGPSKQPGQLEWYIAHLDAHITASRRALRGIPTGPGRAQILPSSVWPSEVKSHFFASLSRHSRYRPDLIASELDVLEVGVQAYLDLLSNGLSQIESRGNGSLDGAGAGAGTDAAPGGSIPRRDRSRRWRSSNRWKPGYAPTAREVSDSWLEVEERLAKEVGEDVLRRSKAEDDSLRAKERRRTERAMKKEIESTEELSKVEKGEMRAERSLDLRSRWAREDWGRELDEGKLAMVDKLTRPAWCAWYNDRVATLKATSIPGMQADEDHPGHSSPAPRPEFEVGDGGTAVHAQISASSPGITINFSETPTMDAKIRTEDNELNRLLSIAKKDRTPSERELLTKLKNRKRNRDGKRLKTLLGQGKTTEEIEEAGGVDEFFFKAKAKAKGKGAEQNTVLNGEHSTPTNVDPDSTPNSDTIVNAGVPLAEVDTRTRISHSKTAAQSSLNVKAAAKALEKLLDPSLRDLRTINMATFLLERHFDLYNLSALAKNILRGQVLSFEVISQIHRELIAYLKPLILRIILIAEQDPRRAGDSREHTGLENITAPSSFPVPAVKNEIGADSQGEISRNHVYQALAFEDTIATGWLKSGSHTDSIREQLSRTPSDSSHGYGPQPISPEITPPIPEHPEPEDEEESDEGSSADCLEEEVDEEEEEEEDQLDAALCEMDTVWDKAYEDSLFAHHDDAFTRPAPDTVISPECEKARGEYIKLRAGINKARRHRAALRLRTEKFTATQRKRGFALANWTSSAKVVDDVDEHEGGGVPGFESDFELSDDSDD